jgi:hypothetical protein
MKTLFGLLKPNSFLLAFGFVLFSTTAIMQSCSPSFDQMGLDNVTNLGSRLTDLMAKAVEPYGKHTDAANTLLSDLGKAAEHAASQKRNKEIASSWKILKDDLAAPFFNRWKEKGKLDKDYVKEAAGQVGKSLDAIKKAELAKKK